MKIGIITSAYEVPRIRTLMRYLAGKADVPLHVEEETLVDFRTRSFDEDGIFTKGTRYASQRSPWIGGSAASSTVRKMRLGPCAASEAACGALR
jgi:hypothetical protein